MCVCVCANLNEKTYLGTGILQLLSSTAFSTVSAILGKFNKDYGINTVNIYNNNYVGGAWFMAQCRSQSHNTPLALTVNCGYFRTAIRELIPKRRGIYGRDVDESKLRQELYKLFNVPGYGFESIEACYKFNKKFNDILNAFGKKWHPASARKEYETTFAISKWKALPDDVKQQHSLSMCSVCYHEYESLQTAFPAKPVYVAPKSSLVSLPAEKTSEREVARKVLTELNLQWSVQYNGTFTKALPKIASELNLIEKPSKIEKKREDRKQKRKIVNHINEQIGKKCYDVCTG